MPEALRRLDDVGQPDELRQTHGRDVDGVLQRAAQRDDAAELPVVVARAVGGLARIDDDRDRPVEDRVGRRVARLERGQIDERLEGRAGLPQGLDGPVELRLGPVVAADHGPDRAGRVLEDHDRALFSRFLLEEQRAAVLPLLQRDGHQVPGLQDPAWPAPLRSRRNPTPGEEESCPRSGLPPTPARRPSRRRAWCRLRQAARSPTTGRRKRRGPNTPRRARLRGWWNP